MLDAQTYKHFDLHVSSGNEKIHKFCKKIVEKHKNDLNIYLYNHGNDYMCFRRFFLAKELAEKGTDIIINIDDDIEFGSKLIEETVKQFEPKTIKPTSAIYLHDGDSYFGSRTVITPELEDKLEADFAVGQYGMFDAKFFIEEPELYNIPKNYYECDDLWASYIAKTKLNWKIKPLHLNIKDKGGDGAALYKKSNKKQELLTQLKVGWLDGRKSFEEKIDELGIKLTEKEIKNRNKLPKDFNTKK